MVHPRLRSFRLACLSLLASLLRSPAPSAASAPPPPGFEPVVKVHLNAGQSVAQGDCCQYFRWCPELKVKHQCHLSVLKSCGANPGGWTSEACKACMMCADAPQMARIGTNEPVTSAYQASGHAPRGSPGGSCTRRPGKTCDG